MSNMEQHIHSTPMDVPLVIAITDIGKDMDDTMALTILAHASSTFGSVRLLCVVANLRNPRRRARTARALLDLKGCEDIPVGFGTDGSRDDHREREYEYNFITPSSPGDDHRLTRGSGLMKACLQTAISNGRKVKVLCTSSLRDIWKMCERYPGLIVAGVEEFCIQGGVEINGENKVIPSPSAANNRFDMDSARSFYSFVQEHGMHCTVCTKHAALASKLSTGLPALLSSFNNEISRGLVKQFAGQTMAFYLDSCGPNPYAPFMNKSWWIENMTTWNQTNPGVEAPEDESILNYVKVPAYDALAALCLSERWMQAAGMEPTGLIRFQNGGSIRVVGFSPSDDGVNRVTGDKNETAIFVTRLLFNSIR